MIRFLNVKLVHSITTDERRSQKDKFSFHLENNIRVGTGPRPVERTRRLNRLKQACKCFKMKWHVLRSGAKRKGYVHGLLTYFDSSYFNPKVPILLCSYARCNLSSPPLCVKETGMSMDYLPTLVSSYISPILLTNTEV